MFLQLCKKCESLLRLKTSSKVVKRSNYLKTSQQVQTQNKLNDFKMFQ